MLGGELAASIECQTVTKEISTYKFTTSCPCSFSAAAAVARARLHAGDAGIVPIMYSC